jgi:hypothetical protein
MTPQEVADLINSNQLDLKSNLDKDRLQILDGLQKERCACKQNLLVEILQRQTEVATQKN